MAAWTETPDVFEPVRRAQELQRRRFHMQESLLDQPPVPIPAALAEPEGAERRTPRGNPIATGSVCKASGSANAPTTDFINNDGSGLAHSEGAREAGAWEES